MATSQGWLPPPVSDYYVITYFNLFWLLVFHIPAVWQCVQLTYSHMVTSTQIYFFSVRMNHIDNDFLDTRLVGVT